MGILEESATRIILLFDENAGSQRNEMYISAPSGGILQVAAPGNGLNRHLRKITMLSIHRAKKAISSL